MFQNKLHQESKFSSIFVVVVQNGAMFKINTFDKKRYHWILLVLKQMYKPSKLSVTMTEYFEWYSMRSFRFIVQHSLFHTNTHKKNFNHFEIWTIFFLSGFLCVCVSEFHFFIHFICSFFYKTIQLFNANKFIFIIYRMCERGGGVFINVCCVCEY